MCVNPITIKNPANPRRGMVIPCGVCLECKKKYQNSWVIRLEEQMKECNYKCVFFTLTYADEAIPMNLIYEGEVYKTQADYRYDNNPGFVSTVTGDFLDFTIDYVDFNKVDLKEFYKSIKEEGVTKPVKFNSIRKKDVQEWNNRCRKRYRKATGNSTKYFITSEYGPRTMRPHYHGVMFNITAEDFKEYFKKDWCTHFGRKGYEDKCVIVEDIDPRYGGIQYVTKYCSKGVFEHPFCSKDFFYAYKERGEMIFSEYHSKHYERCIEYFGIDEPIVDRAEKLISLGMGKSFLNNDRLMRYYDVGIDDVIDYDLKQISSEAAYYLGLDKCEVEDDGTIYRRVNVQSKEMQPAYQFDDLIEYAGEARFSYDKSIVNQFVKLGDKYYSKVYRFVEDHIYQDVDIHCVDGTMYTSSLRDYLENVQNKLLYNKNGNKKGQDKVFSYAMPKYYREKMFGDEVRHLFACIVSEKHDEVYKEQYKQLQTANPNWTDMEISIFIEASEFEERKCRNRELNKKMKEFYDKSKL